MTDHLDLDALADILADIESGATSGAAGLPAHLTDCAQCAAGLAELRATEDLVRSQLAALPDPPLPDGLADRLTATLAAAAVENRAGTVTALPARATDRGARRWLPAAAAAVLLLGGATFGLSQLSGPDARTESAGDASAAKAGGAEAGVVHNDSGTNYTDRASLTAAVPSLLSGTATRRSADSAAVAGAPAPGAVGMSPGPARDAPQAVPADPLAPLRDTTGLADCLLALLPPDDPSVRPLALDYGTFKGTPALVVVLPSALPRRLDVFVVGAGCSRANDRVLFYTSIDAP